MLKIYIDPGHGGDSIGASYKGRVEQDDVLRLSLKIRDLLLKQPDVAVKMSRTTSVNPSISARCAEANAWGADYFLSVHRNAVAPNVATGVEIWVYSRVAVNGITYNIAKNIVDAVADATGYKNRGIRLGAPNYTDYGVNRLTNMSSSLIELGFIDNDKDNKIYDDKFNEMAESIARSLIEAHGRTYAITTVKPVAPKPEPKPETKPVENKPSVEEPADESNKLFKIRIGAFKIEDGAKSLAAEAKAKGFETLIVKEDGYWKVQIGALSTRKAAEALADKAEDAGYGTVFVVVDKETKKVLLGDIDGDGKISAADARLALRASVGLETLTEEQMKRADMDGDGKITAADSREILRQSVGME